jgi:hypothetical protein
LGGCVKPTGQSLFFRQPLLDAPDRLREGFAEVPQVRNSLARSAREVLGCRRYGGRALPFKGLR